jgi:hypothetical protein
VGVAVGVEVAVDVLVAVPVDVAVAVLVAVPVCVRVTVLIGVVVVDAGEGGVLVFVAERGVLVFVGVWVIGFVTVFVTVLVCVGVFVGVGVLLLRRLKTRDALVAVSQGVEEGFSVGKNESGLGVGVQVGGRD